MNVKEMCQLQKSISLVAKGSKCCHSSVVIDFQCSHDAGVKMCQLQFFFKSAIFKIHTDNVPFLGAQKVNTSHSSFLSNYVCIV